MPSLTSIPFIGTPVPAGSTVVRTAVALLGLNSLPWVLGTVIVAAGLIVWSCRKTPGLTRRRWISLAVVRIAIVMAVALIMLRPTLRVTFDRTVQPTLPILIDGSQSMANPDKRLDADDKARAGIGMGLLDPLGGVRQKLPATSQPTPTRESLVRSALTNEKLGLLRSLQKRFDLQPYQFSESLTELSAAGWVDHLTDTGTETAIGDNLQELLARNRGRPLAGIFLVTDGRNNAGSPLATAAELAKSQGIKLFIYGVGTEHPKDVVVSAVYAPEVAFIAPKDKKPDANKTTDSRVEPPHFDEKVPVTVRFAGVGLTGQTANLVIKLGDKKVAERQVTFKAGDQTEVVPITPTDTGSFAITASIEARPDEENPNNNTATAPGLLRVTDKQIRVLMVDSSPRWEFKYVLATLLNDPRVRVHCLLQDGDPGVQGEGSPYIKLFPATKAELFDQYDEIVLGDVDPAGFSDDQRDSINEFVSKNGGGLLVVPGHRFGLEKLSATKIGDLLPVLPLADTKTSGTKAIHLRLTPAGKRSPTMKLADDDLESQRLWQSVEKETPIYWDLPVKTKVDRADVLLEDPGNDNRPMPVLVVQQAGKGQVMFLGTDNTWRWRQNDKEKLYQIFWGQLVQRLALAHLVGENARTQFASGDENHSVGQTVNVYVRLYDQGYEPVTDLEVPGTAVFNKGERTLPLKFTPVAGEPGNYKASFLALAAGDYQVRLDREPDSNAMRLFQVNMSTLEQSDSSLYAEGLTAIAAKTGGRFFREEDLHDLPAAIEANVETVRSTADVDLGASPIWFGVILVLATIEWVLRKIFQVK